MESGGSFLEIMCGQGCKNDIHKIIQFWHYEKLYREDIRSIGVNGMCVVCPGVTDGQIIILLEDDTRSIMVVSTASNPDVKPICEILQKLVQKHFPQCIYAYFYLLY